MAPEYQEDPEFSFATISSVTGTGVTLILDGQDEDGGKEYKANACAVFQVGDRVKVHKDSGTLVVEFPIGAPGSRVPIPAGGSDGQVLKKASAADFDVEWGDGGGLPSGGSNGQVLTKKTGGAEWKDAPTKIPSGGAKDAVLKKKSATDYDTEWGDAPGALPSGGTAGKFLRKKSSTNYDAEWADPSVARLAYSSSVAVEIGSTGVIQSINTTQPSLGSSTYGKQFKDLYTSGGNISLGASKLGFFGTTPISKQTLSNSATLAQLITALKNYGLFT